MRKVAIKVTRLHIINLQLWCLLKSLVSDIKSSKQGWRQLMEDCNNNWLFFLSEQLVSLVAFSSFFFSLYYCHQINDIITIRCLFLFNSDTIVIAMKLTCEFSSRKCLKNCIKYFMSIKRTFCTPCTCKLLRNTFYTCEHFMDTSYSAVRLYLGHSVKETITITIIIRRTTILIIGNQRKTQLQREKD